MVVPLRQGLVWECIVQRTTTATFFHAMRHCNCTNLYARRHIGHIHLIRLFYTSSEWQKPQNKSKFTMDICTMEFRRITVSLEYLQNTNHLYASRLAQQYKTKN